MLVRTKFVLYNYNVMNVIQQVGVQMHLQSFPGFIFDIFPYFNWKFFN